jgi:hypothetical protein
VLIVCQIFLFVSMVTCDNYCCETRNIYLLRFGETISFTDSQTKTIKCRLGGSVLVKNISRR